MNMNILMSNEIQEELKTELTKSGKTAARFIVSSIGCKGPLFGIEFSDEKDGDVKVEIQGIKFVAESRFVVALKSPEIIKEGDKFKVKKPSCC